MIRRFQIEDLISQDTSGVVFRAVDTQTGKHVALRRFFPFGAAGGGLDADEQCAYQIAIDRLAELRHPALRSIIGGGCDPVDGMPYIATEWIDGVPLESLMHESPLSAEVATELIAQGLEVCELLSQVLAEDAVWVETRLSSIICGNSQSGRGWTFWISPMKWLGGPKTSRGMESIITLTEKVMGWKGRKIHDQAGHGLAAWIKRLRNAMGSMSLREARKTLAAAIGAPPPQTNKTIVPRAPRPTPCVIDPPPAKSFLILNVGLAVCAVSLCGWFLVRQCQRPSPSVASSADSGSAPQSAQSSAPQSMSLLEQQEEAAAKNGGVIAWSSRELLEHLDGEEVDIDGILTDVNPLASKTKIYLLFFKPATKNDPRGTVTVKTAPANLSRAALTSLIGRKIRIHGTIEVINTAGTKRAEIEIRDFSSIRVME